MRAIACKVCCNRVRIFTHWCRSRSKLRKSRCSVEGIQIAEVMKDSPAEKAGIKPGDAIVELNRRAVAVASVGLTCHANAVSS